MNKIKYPRTPHLPESLSISSDDKILTNTNHLIGKEIIATIKMDGECTSMYSNLIHARSLDSCDHESRHWVKMLHSTIKNDIPNDMRICGENLFAKHSIHYTNLESYFQVFSIWQNDIVLSWKETVEWSSLLNLSTVQVIFQGIWNESTHKICINQLNLQEDEGYVIRLADSFKINEFDKSVAKFVRKNHVQTDQHWMNQKVIKNILAS